MVAIPAILILMLILGVNISSYQGMSVSDAWQQARANHDYSVSQDTFDKAAQPYINNADFSDEIITAGMIIDANRVYMQQNAFDYFVESGGILYEEINGSFDTSWQPSAESRTIKVYDDQGVLLGATTIIGVVSGTIPISRYETSRPALVNNTGYFQTGYLLFQTTDTIHGTYYHTQLDGVYNGSPVSTSGIGINMFNYQYWYNNTADNVSFADVGGDYFPLQLVYQGSIYTSTFQYASPVQGQGDISGDTSYIGTATLPDGTEAGINPDGSITLPDGTTVYRDPVTGLYPQGITADFPADWWADFAERVGQSASTGTASDATQQMQWDISGLRDIASSILSYLRTGFWTKVNETIDGFFHPNIDPSEIEASTPEDDKIKQIVNTIFNNFDLEEVQ